MTLKHIAEVAPLIHQRQREQGKWDPNQNKGEMFMDVVCSLVDCIRSYEMKYSVGKRYSKDIAAAIYSIDPSAFVEAPGAFKGLIEDTLEDAIATAIYKFAGIMSHVGISFVDPNGRVEYNNVNIHNLKDLCLFITRKMSNATFAIRKDIRDNGTREDLIKKHMTDAYYSLENLAKFYDINLEWHFYARMAFERIKE